MSKFVKNVNMYLSQMKIKQTYISLKTGIDTKKISRILTGIQDVSATDMEKIAISLGKKPEYFLNEEFAITEKSNIGTERIAFYAGHPLQLTEKQDQIAGKLEKLMGNIDEVMSAKHRFLNISKE